MREVIIIGSGPAGYTAAIYAARAGLNPLMIASSVEPGGELMKTTEVENFPGFPGGLMGPDLMAKFQEQAESFGTEILLQDVVEVDLKANPKIVKCGNGDVFEAKADALARASAAFAAAGDAARAVGVTYCIEPLSADQTPLINTVAEAAEIVRAVNDPHLRTMIDTSSAGLAESLSVPALIEHWLPSGLVAHIQLNDPNRRAPGQGEMAFGPVLAALQRGGWQGWVAVEPFDYVPDGPGSAAWSAGYLRGLMQGLDINA